MPHSLKQGALYIHLTATVIEVGVSRRSSQKFSET